MKSVNIQDAKTHLSQYLNDVENGEVIVLCRHNKPIAEIRALKATENRVPQFGIYEGYTVPESFFDPLPDDILRAFNGE